ncbi:MAG: AAA family ATPase [Cyanobacteriota bacterium]|nr:AAA family ATPase [Cyanobacteriota bacterium]
MSKPDLRQSFLSLPENASEAIVDSLLIPPLLNSLGFDLQERVPQYPTGNGSDLVDYALRHNTETDIFIQTKNNPDILLELKGKDINLSQGSAQYKSTVKQLKRYLLSAKCQSVRWGLITNSSHIQMFRKHGKVIHPATRCIEISLDTIDPIVREIKTKINSLSQALTIAVYNNKGGVGKTTTTLNLAATLTRLGKRVLVVDFDANQQDLTNSLKTKTKPASQTLYSCLSNKNIGTTDAIGAYIITAKNKELKFDIIPADLELARKGEDELRTLFGIKRLSKILEPIKTDYDYILIDSPPNWRLFSQSAIYAADVVLIPTKHNNIYSLENAALAISNFIPQIQQERQDGSPVALPIFFNGEKITEAQRNTVNSTLVSLIKKTKKECGFSLEPYFYPRYTKSKRDYHIFELPNYANIASSAFSRIPAAYRDKIAYSYYRNLAKEYFLQ